MQISKPCTRGLNLVALAGSSMLCRQAPRVMEWGWLMNQTLKTIRLALGRPLINGC